MNAHDTLTLWENFYVIVGSSAGALTGLQFVVMALVSDSDRKGGEPDISAFGTPNVVHFSAVLLVSAILSAPWPNLSSTPTIVRVCRPLGAVYTSIVIRRARRPTVCQPAL